tara:strand:+ start:90285 stop:90476 length:192 start_codon:yes stop_codon:yes gene_type:complete
MDAENAASSIAVSGDVAGADASSIVNKLCGFTAFSGESDAAVVFSGNIASVVATEGSGSAEMT